MLERTTAAGCRVRIGQSARENDRLTFQLATGRDVFLHVDGHPGAHVLLTPPSGEGPPADACLREAAAHALAHSPRAPRCAPVLACSVLDVTKPPKAPPGQVAVPDGAARIHLLADSKKVSLCLTKSVP